MERSIHKKDNHIILVTVRQYCYNCTTKKNRTKTCVDGIVEKEKCKKCGFHLHQIVLTEGD